MLFVVKKRFLTPFLLNSELGKEGNVRILAKTSDYLQRKQVANKQLSSIVQQRSCNHDQKISTDRCIYTLVPQPAQNLTPASSASPQLLQNFLPPPPAALNITTNENDQSKRERQTESEPAFAGAAAAALGAAALAGAAAFDSLFGALKLVVTLAPAPPAGAPPVRLYLRAEAEADGEMQSENQR